MNLKSEKGATGSDIIFAITAIVLSIAVVSMIYVNTTLQSRNVTRTAGATRIATNILENIEKMSYTDFEAEYMRVKGADPITIIISNYMTYPSLTNTTAFNTKIPRGYTVYIYGEPNFGSHESTTEQFDLVRDIKLTVVFQVGDMEKVVDFSTSKKREIVNEVNEPVTTILVSQGITDNGDKKFYPIKYSEDAKSYIRTSGDDPEWYNYPNKKWAMVIVSTENEEELFDLNGKLIALSSKYKKYAWIPKYFYSENGTGQQISEFAYQSSSDKAIKSKQELKAMDNSTILYYNTYGAKLDTSIEPTSFVLNGNQKISGKWVLADTIYNITSDTDGNLLNSSIYGPCEIH